MNVTSVTLFVLVSLEASTLQSQSLFHRSSCPLVPHPFHHRDDRTHLRVRRIHRGAGRNLPCPVPSRVRPCPVQVLPFAVQHPYLFVLSHPRRRRAFPSRALR